MPRDYSHDTAILFDQDSGTGLQTSGHFLRTGINLDSYNDATHHVFGNTFVSAGSGISVGTPTGATVTGIHNNNFQTVGDDFNFQNVTTPLTIDMTATANTASGGDGVLQILGSSVGDSIKGSSGADSIIANGGDDTIFRDAGNDSIDGGTGTDTYVLPGPWTDYAITRAGATYTIVKGGETITIPPNAPHLVEALEDAIATDLFCPIREDWIRGDDAYLRGQK